MRHKVLHLKTHAPDRCGIGIGVRGDLPAPARRRQRQGNRQRCAALTLRLEGVTSRLLAVRAQQLEHQRAVRNRLGHRIPRQRGKLYRFTGAVDAALGVQKRIHRPCGRAPIHAPVG